MKLEQLKYMRAIVEKGSFRAAAESVYRSQSSLSISIQKLEKELGFQIFSRDNYRPKLTKSGHAIYQKVLVLLNKSQEIQNLAAHLASNSEAELKLAISGVVPIEPIIAAVNQVTKLYPETRMTLLIENLGGTIERVRDDDADIAITDAFEHSDDVDFEGSILTKIAFVSVVPSQSLWAKFPCTITEQDLENETLIVVRDTSTHSPRLSKGLIAGAPQWVVNDFATKQRIIRSGKGWGRMPLHLVADDIEQQKLTPLRSKAFKHRAVPIHIVQKKNRPRGPVEQALWIALQQINWAEHAKQI